MARAPDRTVIDSLAPDLAGVVLLARVSSVAYDPHALGGPRAVLALCDASGACDVAVVDSTPGTPLLRIARLILPGTVVLLSGVATRRHPIRPRALLCSCLARSGGAIRLLTPLATSEHIAGVPSRLAACVRGCVASATVKATIVAPIDLGIPCYNPSTSLK